MQQIYQMFPHNAWQSFFFFFQQICIDFSYFATNTYIVVTH